MGSQLLKFADEASLKTYVSVNMKGNVWKNKIVKDASKFVWENSSFTAKKWMINNNVTSTVSKFYNTNYEYVGPKALNTYMKMYENTNNAIELLK